MPAYVLAQVAGAFAGVAAADVMFELPALSASRHARTGPAQWLSEAVATFGLLAVIWGCSRRRSPAVPFAVGAYVTAAYWFTASTSFANPAVTLARAAMDTFACIRPADVLAPMPAPAWGTTTALALELTSRRVALLSVVARVAMGEAGMGGMMDMGRPRNTLPMMSGQGPYGAIQMGGMFTILKVRDGLTSYADPGFYQHPAGTVARKVPTPT